VAGLGLREAIIVSGSVCLLVTIIPLLRYRPSVHGRLLADDADKGDPETSAEEVDDLPEGEKADTEAPVAEKR
jgi:hypothetical protein